MSIDPEVFELTADVVTIFLLSKTNDRQEISCTRALYVGRVLGKQVSYV